MNTLPTGGEPANAPHTTSASDAWRKRLMRKLNFPEDTLRARSDSYRISPLHECREDHKCKRRQRRRHNHNNKRRKRRRGHQRQRRNRDANPHNAEDKRRQQRSTREMERRRDRAVDWCGRRLALPHEMAQQLHKLMTIRGTGRHAMRLTPPMDMYVIVSPILRAGSRRGGTRTHWRCRWSRPAHPQPPTPPPHRTRHGTPADRGMGDQANVQHS